MIESERFITLTVTREAEDIEDLMLLDCLLTRWQEDLSCVKSFQHVLSFLRYWLELTADAVEAYDYERMFPPDIADRLRRAARCLGGEG